MYNLINSNCQLIIINNIFMLILQIDLLPKVQGKLRLFYIICGVIKLKNLKPKLWN